MQQGGTGSEKNIRCRFYFNTSLAELTDYVIRHIVVLCHHCYQILLDFVQTLSKLSKFVVIRSLWDCVGFLAPKLLWAD